MGSRRASFGRAGQAPGGLEETSNHTRRWTEQRWRLVAAAIERLGASLDESTGARSIAQVGQAPGDGGETPTLLARLAKRRSVGGWHAAEKRTGVRVTWSPQDLRR